MASDLDDLARPMLEVLRRVTGLESTFVTAIDWENQTQEVLVAHNDGEIVVTEGLVTDWAETMCRRSFLSGHELSTDVGGDFPGSVGDVELGMRTYLAVPITDEGRIFGTVCGASTSEVLVTDDALDLVRLVAEAVGGQVAAHLRARRAEAEAAAATDLATTDSLTGLANRRGFAARWEQELARSARHGSPLALLLVDIDGFKAVNDGHGHGAGDGVLRVVADVLAGAVRSGDLAARLGGDELGLALAGADTASAVAVAERVLDAVRRGTAAAGVAATVSIGVSATDVAAPADLVDTADAALLRAKRAGRDRVEVWQGAPVAAPS